jgi:hypothetical protein
MAMDELRAPWPTMGELGGEGREGEWDGERERGAWLGAARSGGLGPWLLGSVLLLLYMLCAWGRRCGVERKEKREKKKREKERKRKGKKNGNLLNPEILGEKNKR